MEVFDYLLGKKAGGGSPTPINLQDKEITITQNGETTVSADTGYDGLSSVDITTNVPAQEKTKDVVFYDYDGTELYSYTKDEFLALTEMPANPTHTGLTAQGWNWTLSSAKNYVGTQGLGVLDIGQNYITDNGETRYYLTILNANKSITLNLRVKGTIIINWGDGSETEEASGTSTESVITKQHTYNNVGNYVIRIMAKTQETKINVITNRCLNENQDSLMISKIEIGSNCDTIVGITGGSPANNLEIITIPTNVKYFGNSSFTSMYNLKALIVPEGVEACDSISGVYSMKILSLSSSVNSLTVSGLNQSRICMYIPTNNLSFQECRGLKKVYLYAVSGSIAYSFRTTGMEKLVIFGGTSLNVQQNDKLKELDFRETLINTITLSSSLWPANRGLEIVRYNESAPFYGFNTQSTNLKLIDFRTRTTIPSISSTAVTNFTTYQPRCKFVVPDNLYTAWIATSGWSSLANRIIKASDYTEE